MNTKELISDILIIGGGPAAFFAAIKAKEAGIERVTMVCKAVSGSSGCAIWMMGNIRDYRPEESESLLHTLVPQGSFLVDQDWLKQTIKENSNTVNDLRKWGVKFLKERGKEIRAGMGVFVGGKANPNIWVEGGGMQMLWTLRGQALKIGVQIIDRVMITDLLTSDGKQPTKTEVVGAVGLNVRSGDFYVFKARATIIASGRSSIPKRIPADCTGDGQAMAIRAGAEMRSMDTVRFLGGGTLGNATTGTSHVFSSFGVKLINELYPQQEEEKDYSSRQSTRGAKWKFDMGKAQEAVRIEQKDVSSPESYGGPCWDWGWRASFRECSPKNLQIVYKTNPRIMKIFEKLGYEIPEDTPPMVRFPFEGGGARTQGGILINRNHESSIPGLFVAGDATDEIGYIAAGGIPMAMTGGRIAGISAAKYAKKMNDPKIVAKQVEKIKETIYIPLEVKKGISPSKLRNKAVEAACLAILEKGFVVNEESLQRAIDALDILRREDLPKLVAKDPHHLMKANELRSILEVIPLQFRAAQLRKESRILAREDYPYIDQKNWLKFINLKLNERGEVNFWTEELPPMKIKPEGV